MIQLDIFFLLFNLFCGLDFTLSAYEFYKKGKASYDKPNKVGLWVIKLYDWLHTRPGRKVGQRPALTLPKHIAVYALICGIMCLLSAFLAAASLIERLTE